MHWAGSIVFLGLTMGWGTSSCSSTPPPQHGFLTLRSEQRGLPVYLDERLIGDLPLTAVPVDTGEHTVRVSHPDRLTWIDQDWVTEIHVTPGDTIVLDVVFQVYYSIQSNPFGARAIYLGEEVGETPLWFALNAGAVDTLILQKAGYEDYKLILSEAKGRYYSVNLVPKPGAQKTELQAQVKEERVKRTRKLVAYSTIGVGVASGLVTLLFKRLADDRYEQYLRSGDLNEMNRLYDSSKKFDRLAGVSFGFFQVSFAFSIYLLIRGVPF